MSLIKYLVPALVVAAGVTYGVALLLPPAMVWFGPVFGVGLGWVLGTGAANLAFGEEQRKWR